MSLLSNAERHLRTLEEIGVVSDQARGILIVVDEMIEERSDRILERVSLMHSDVDLRLDRMESSMDHRLEGMDRRLDRMESDMNHRFEQVDHRFDQMESEMNLRFVQMQASIDAKLAVVMIGFRLILGRFEQIDDQFDLIRDRFDMIKDQFIAIDKRFKSLERWQPIKTTIYTIGTLLALAAMNGEGLRFLDFLN